MIRRGVGVSRALAAAAVVALAGPVFSPTAAQVVESGQNVVPVYEGWEQNTDGTFNLVFGYFNRNWDEELDVPVGPDNKLEPGGADQGQPTRFLPRRNRFLFRIRVPKDFGKSEVVWTLTSRGKTERAYGTLKPDYFIDDIVIQNNNGAGGAGGGAPDTIGNKPPSMEVTGGNQRKVRVGEPVMLTAFATDDGMPKPRAMPMPQSAAGRAARGTPNAATGLRLAWFVYRGAGKVTFDPPQFDVWENYREGGNSPWAPGWKTPSVPQGGKWDYRVTFDQPGTYVLRCLAHDGGLMRSEDVTFIVTR